MRGLNPYHRGVTKLAAEQLCYLYYVNHSVPTVALRYFTVYGPRQRPDMGFSRFFEAVLRDEPVPIFGDGRQTRDFTFVADAVSATVASATRGTPGGTTSEGGLAWSSSTCSSSSGSSQAALCDSRVSKRSAVTCATLMQTPHGREPIWHLPRRLRSNRVFARNTSG